MLDLKTVLVVTVATASLQAVVWAVVCQAWRSLAGFRFFAVGLCAIAAGVLLMLLRGEQPAGWAIILHNALIKLGLVLMAQGLARFLGQPPRAWLGAGLLGLYVGVWGLAIAFDPENIALRIHASTFFTVVMMSAMCLTLLRDRTQSGLLRWVTIGVLGEYMVASILQSVIEYRLPADFQTQAILADRNAWYLLQGTLFLIAFFACLLFMVSARLSADLRGKNEALSREVNERQRLERQLSASLETERALREEQKDFMRLVSHEFRTPLAIIRNAVDMIELVGERSPQAIRQRLSGIGEALDRLFALIDRFMANDRDSGFQPTPTRVGALVDEVRLHFEMTGGGERLRFGVEGEDVTLHADREMLATVVINLVDNALKYSPPAQPVCVSVCRDEDCVRIAVRDRGIGIPAAELHKIGRRFFRASNAMAGTGTGLGLYASRKLLGYHEGRLQLRANHDGGTLAVIHLPLRTAAGAEPGR